jgi:penicillin amidase
MRLLFRLLLALTAAAAAAGAGAAALVWYLAARSLPDYEAQWRLPGLSAPVEIVRDAHAVPHVLADTDEDAMFGLGFAHAQDRLWQMEVQRRAAQGRLSELFGREALRTDRAMRALDLAGHARAAVQTQTPATRALLDAYARGVNARLRAVNERALGRGAPEFFLFGGAALAPWTAADSLAVVKLMALRLTVSARLEARRARLTARLTPERLADIDLGAPDPALLAPPAPPRPDAAALEAARLASTFPLSPFAEPGFGGASNAWAVDGRRSATGAPLLATDPHLWLSAPSVWHLARLRSPGFDVIGASIPGVPAVLIGRNDRFAWGLTTAHVDDQDLFIERIDPDDPGRYLTPDGWRAFETRRETIRVAGGGAETVTLRRTQRGPVAPPDSDLDFSSVTPEGHVVSLAWTALTADDGSLAAAHALMRAGSLAEGEAAAALHTAPAQNVVMADANGVGLVVAGVAPLRREDSRTRGAVPSLGWLPENQWIGRIPAAETPRALNPEGGAVANANNRTTDAAFPRHLTFDWPEPYRIRRIAARLGDRAFHSRESFVELQTDTVSDMARAVLPVIARELWWGADSAPSDGPPERAEALRLLRDWNGAMSEHDAAPLIFTVWVRALTRRLAEDELGPLLGDIPAAHPLLIERAFHDVGGASRWCDVVKTPDVEPCAEIARRALDDALAELSRRFGPRPSSWRWGAAHVATHVHTPLGYGRLAGMLLNIAHETSGGDHTVMVGQTRGRGENPEANVHAAGFRAVYDFADLDRSLFVIATGQSGHPLSRHYDDLGTLWRRGDYVPMSLDPADARAGALGVTRLSPAP